LGTFPGKRIAVLEHTCHRVSGLVQREVDGDFAMYPGKLPSMLARTSVEECRPAVGWGGRARLFPGMDGDETWRMPSICGVSAVYSGNAPNNLANMAPPKFLAIWLKINYCTNIQYIFIGRYGMESRTNPRTYWGAFGK
jgi:hypothetical protein